jgi:signal transduction histidine kinase
MSEQALQRSQHFFVSSVVPGEPTYAYSKDHGMPFSGLGVGLPMAALYVQYMGGSLRIDQHEDEQGKGTRVLIRLPRDGFECA